MFVWSGVTGRVSFGFVSSNFCLASVLCTWCSCMCIGYTLTLSSVSAAYTGPWRACSLPPSSEDLYFIRAGGDEVSPRGSGKYWHGECHCTSQSTYTVWEMCLMLRSQDTPLSGHLTNSDTPLIRTPHYSGHSTSGHLPNQDTPLQDTSLIRTPPRIWHTHSFTGAAFCCRVVSRDTVGTLHHDCLD